MPRVGGMSEGRRVHMTSSERVAVGVGNRIELRANLAEGGGAVVDQLFPLVYDQLRKIASRRMREERTDHTLDATALVHETYLEMMRFGSIEIESRAHFVALAAWAMRRVLVDHAVRHNAQKRGGEQQKVPLDEVSLAAIEHGDEVLALDEALERLGTMNPRHARVVECRFFGGMSIEETAEALGISPATVKREWTLARAWLNRELRQA